MKTERSYPAVTVHRRGAERIQGGHPWVFDNEITGERGAPQDGALCDVLSPKGRYLGTGFYNSRSKIRVRILSRNATTPSARPSSPAGCSTPGTTAKPSWARTPPAAGDLRRGGPLPRPHVDKFGDILVTQTMSLGLEKVKPLVFPLLVQAIEKDGQPIRGIYERNDGKLRELEGLEQGKGWFPWRAAPPRSPP